MTIIMDQICQSVSNSHTQADDAKQRKQERERARYAEQRNEINRKRREKYHIKTENYSHWWIER